MIETSAVRIVARIAPWLAPVPSGYFIARSSYVHLLSSDVPYLAIPVAIIIGLIMEMLGVASIHTLQDLNRWNRQPNVQKGVGHWEKAPTGAAQIAVATYFFAAFMLLFVLETVAVAARVAPFLFPLVAIAGAIVWSVSNQHQERKERYGVDDTLKPGSLKAKPAEQEAEPKPKAAKFACDYPGCNRSFKSQNALNAHSRSHPSNGKRNEPIPERVVANG